MWVSANAMLSVPSVTMNAGSRYERHKTAVQHPEGDAGQDPERDRQERGHAVVDRELGHHDLSERHHGADREVDPGRQDHQRLADREHADDHHLLQHEREVLGVQEAI